MITPERLAELTTNAHRRQDGAHYVELTPAELLELANAKHADDLATLATGLVDNPNIKTINLPAKQLQPLCPTNSPTPPDNAGV